LIRSITSWPLPASSSSKPRGVAGMSKPRKVKSGRPSLVKPRD